MKRIDRQNFAIGTNDRTAIADVLAAAVATTEQILRLSDELTMKGMSRYGEAPTSPEENKSRAEFFRQAIEFYEQLLHEPHIAKPIQALAFALGFTRMVGTGDPRAAKELQQSLDLYKELLAGSPDDTELRAQSAKWN